MNILKKIFGPKEMRAALGVLDELECKFDSTWRSRQAFQIVRRQLEPMILADPATFVAVIRKQEMRVREWVVGAVANIAGDHAESGEFHWHRGSLNSMGPGDDLVKIHDAMVDELTRLGTHTAEKAERLKAGLREQIRTVG